MGMILFPLNSVSRSVKHILTFELQSWKGPYGSLSPGPAKEAQWGIELPTSATELSSSYGEESTIYSIFTQCTGEKGVFLEHFPHRVQQFSVQPLEENRLVNTCMRPYFQAYMQGMGN